jgi:hypothetical protein
MTTTPNLPVRSVLALTLCALGTACFTTSGDLGDLEDDGGADGMAEDDAAGPGVSATSTGGGDGDGDDAGESSGGDGPIPACTGLGPSEGRALDGVKWHNAVADLLQVESIIEVEASWNTPAYPAPVPSSELAPIYEAEAVVVAGVADVGALLSCAPDTASPEADACIEAFATTLGRLAWRRALAADELDALLALDPGGTAESRARAVIGSLLSSPRFWTIDESGTPDPENPGVLLLDQHAIASRLAYFVWNSTPDDQLLTRAEAGELSDPAVRAAEVDRMLADPRGARAIGDFWEAVLDTRALAEGQHDAELFPQMDATLVAAMREEVRRFAADVVLDEGTWSVLLNATHSFVNGPLAASVYEGEIVGTPPTGDAFEPVQLDPERRPGILTRAAPLARWTHPAYLGIYRGMLVRDRMLCMQLPPPPPDVDPGPPPPEGLDRYDWLDHHSADAACAGCHTLVDPIVPGFDNYDPIGQWQTDITSAGGPPSSGAPTVPVNTAGEVVDLAGDGTFEDLPGLLAILTNAPESMGCQVQHQLEYAFGRGLRDEDLCTLDALSQAFIQSGGDLRQLAHDVVASDVFVRVRQE